MTPSARAPIVVTPNALSKASAIVAAAKAAAPADYESLTLVMPNGVVGCTALTTFQQERDCGLSGGADVANLCVRGRISGGLRSIWNGLPFHSLPQEDPPRIAEMDFVACRHLELSHAPSHNGRVTLRFSLKREALAADPGQNSLELNIACHAALNDQPTRRAGEQYFDGDGFSTYERHVFSACGYRFSEGFGEAAIAAGLALLFDLQIVAERSA